MSHHPVTRRTLLVLASTYPRWLDDAEPGFVHQLSKRLLGQFRVIVLCPHAAGARELEMLEGVEVRRYRYAPQRLESLVNNGGIVTNLRNKRWKWLLVPGFVLLQAVEAWRLCRREGVDVIHAHWLIPQGLIAALLQYLPGPSVPYLVTSHGADLYALKGRALTRIKRWVLSRAGVATVVSHAMLRELTTIGVEAGKVAVIPMGVDIQERFSPDMTQPRSDSELLFVGRLVEKKGVRHLINALPEVLAQRPGVTLTVAGFGPDEAELKAQVAALGLDEAVRFLGAVPQVQLPQLYRRAALVVAPFVRAESGDQEGLPVALMEAVACGCPVVAGNIEGIEDLIGELKSEVCVDARDTNALVRKIVEALSHPELARERAQRTLAAAAGLVDWSRIAARYADLLEETVNA